jgi:hypothetical protein
MVRGIQNPEHCLYELLVKTIDRSSLINYKTEQRQRRISQDQELKETSQDQDKYIDYRSNTQVRSQDDALQDAPFDGTDWYGGSSWRRGGYYLA